MKPRIKSEPIIIHARKLIDVVKLENKCSYRTAIRNVDDYAMIVIPVRTTSKKGKPTTKKYFLDTETTKFLRDHGFSGMNVYTHE